MEGHEERAAELEYELADMQKQSDGLADDIHEARDDWDAKKGDDSGPGAGTGEDDEGADPEGAGADRAGGGRGRRGGRPRGDGRRPGRGRRARGRGREELAGEGQAERGDRHAALL